MTAHIVKYNNCIKVFYYNNCEIYIREYKDGLWSSPQVIAEDARENFSVAYGQKDMILYQLISGDMCITEEKGKPKTILKATSNSAPNILINAITSENEVTLLYNIIENNENKIVSQYQGMDRHWSSPKIIDSFEPFGDIMRIAELSANHHIVFYSKKMPEYQFGYREILRYNIREYKMIFATGHSVTDFSYVITKEALHFVFIQSKGFSSRVIYIRKDSDSTSKPVTIFEGFNIKNCLIGVMSNKLYIWWATNKILNFTVSYNFGYSFNPVQTDRSINTDYIKKAVFTDKTPSLADNYIFNEIYVSKDRPYDIYFIPDVNKSLNKKDDVESLKKEIEKLRKRLDKMP